jgi:hypothetical protein
MWNDVSIVQKNTERQFAGIMLMIKKIKEKTNEKKVFIYVTYGINSRTEE